MGKKVTQIPAVKDRYSSSPASGSKKRRVAAYARVSTDHDEQLTSYAAQVDYYTNYIKGREDWEFAGVYTDEGITGTNTKNREGFKQMIADALEGKIDLIITKSVSRFARNTVDSLTAIRQLKDKNIECYFEKENIWTFDGKGELLITIMSSLAQEESRSISENCTWGQRKRFADGKVSVPFSRFLGYDRGKDGCLVVNPEQAEIVRRIYGMFLSGMSFCRIARELTADGIPSPGGCERWGQGCIKSILTNEKYKGDALLQKSYTVDFLTKKKKTNEGEIPQYYVHDDHEAIIDPETFDAVQDLIAKRASENNRPYSSSVFAGRIKCGCCGGWYGHKIWHSNDKYRKIVWQCNDKYRGEQKCSSPGISEDEIKDIFLRAANSVIAKKSDVIDTCRLIILPALSTEKLEQEKIELREDLRVTAGLIENIIDENAHAALDQNEYRVRHDSLVERFDRIKNRLDDVNDKISNQRTRCFQIKNYLTDLEVREPLTSFREDDWISMVDHFTVIARDNVIVTFRDGTEFKTEIRKGAKNHA